MPVKRVVFIRPGETEWNKTGRWQGQVQIPLNEHGRAQSKRLAEFLRNVGVDALYSSDLNRAAETARIIGERLALKPNFDERLRERDIGHWQGLTIEEIRDWYAEEYKRIRGNPDGFKIPFGESRHEVAGRLEEFFTEKWQEWNESEGDRVIAVISHSTALRMLLAQLVPDSKPQTLRFKNISVTTLVRDDQDWRIAQLDDVSHLDGMTTHDFPEPEE